MVSATVGQAFAIQPVVYVEDQFGNLETGDNSMVVTAAMRNRSEITSRFSFSGFPGATGSASARPSMGTLA